MTQKSMLAHKKIVDSPEEIRALCQGLRGQGMLALDTEFIRETTFYPVIALMQLSTESESWLVDPILLNKNDLDPLFEILTDANILKILHAAQADQECLYTAFGIVATPSLDTAVAASLCGYGDSIGLSKLLKELLGASLPKGHARTDWTVRPLSPHLMAYAHQDVQYLIPAAKKLLRLLEPKGRASWALELSARFENKKNYEPNPEGLAARLAKSGRLDRRGFATLQELMRWRESRVRQLNVPRRRVADDDVLMDLATVRPKDMEHLGAFRGLNRGEFKSSGELILAAVRRAAAIPEEALPEVPRSEIPNAREARAVELIQCFVKILAEKLEISARHLIGADDILPLLRQRRSSVEDIVRAGFLSEGAGRMIGEDLLAMLQGRRALSIREGIVFMENI